MRSCVGTQHHQALWMNGNTVITSDEGGHMASIEDSAPLDQNKLIKKLKHVVNALKQQNEELRAKCEHNPDTEKVFALTHH